MKSLFFFKKTQNKQTNEKKNRNIKNQLLLAKAEKQVNMLEDLKKETACGGSKNKIQVMYAKK